MFYLQSPGWLCLPFGKTAIGLISCLILTISQPLQARGNIDLAWAIQQTLEKNSELQRYPFELRSAEALKQQASIKPTARLGLEIENVLGKDDFKAADSAEVTLTLSQVIELGGKRKQRIALASASLQQQQAEYELTRLDVLAETSRRYYRLLQLQDQTRLVSQRIQQEQAALAVIRKSAKAGAVGQADVTKMALRLARSKAMQQQLIGEQKRSKLRLAAMWQGSGEFYNVTGNLTQFPAMPSQQTILSALENSPRLMQQLALQRLADTQLALAKANGKGDLEVGAGIRRFESTNEQALTLSFAMPLTFKNPNRGRIAAAQAQVNQSQFEIDQQRRQLELSLLEIQQSLNNSRQQALQISQELLPLANSLLTDTQRGYQSGRYSLLQWVDAQAELFSLKQQLADLHSAIYLQLLELERITGRPMTEVGRGENT